MSTEKDYTKYSFIVTALVIIMMLGLSFVPPFTIGKLRTKRTNILSDFITIGHDSVSSNEFDDSADRLFIDEMERREAELAKSDTTTKNRPHRPKKSHEQSWEIGTAPAGEAKAQVSQPVINGETIIAIEDYSKEDGVNISDFCQLLGTATAKRTVRIAFLGDSYIEGDIITADVRDQLQSLYGGNGVGFVPFSTPLAANRPTIKQTYGGWTNYSVIKKKSVPKALADKFFISGTISIPDSTGAWVQYETTSYRKHVAQSTSLRLLFENTGASALKLTINDSIERRFTPDPGEQVQQIKVGGSGIKKVRVNVENSSGFIGYGVVFESPTGVGVDNYSIRGNSGVALFGTSANVNSQIGKMLGYDLIVMQYGLNAMSPDVTNYANYRKNMVRAVNYIKRSFPNSAILLLGVGDRSTMENGEFVTMPAVYSMIKEQRAIAQECGVAFWNTFTAMGGENSMSDFVAKGWAAKDHTHLSFGGGKYIAKQLVNALLYVRQQAGGNSNSENAATSSQTTAKASQKELHNGSVPTSPIAPGAVKTSTSPVIQTSPASAIHPVNSTSSASPNVPKTTNDPAVTVPASVSPAASMHRANSPTTATSANAPGRKATATPTADEVHTEHGSPTRTAADKKSRKTASPVPDSIHNTEQHSGATPSSGEPPKNIDGDE